MQSLPIDELIKRGRLGLSLDEIKMMEDRLEICPAESDARYVLLSFYLLNYDEREFAQKYLEHLCWLIDNEGENEEIWCRSLFSSYPRNDFKYPTAKERWIAKIQLNSSNVKILRNAAFFLSSYNPDDSIELYLIAESLEPWSPEWSRKLSEIYKNESLRQGNSAKARIAAEKSIQAFARSYDLYSSLGSEDNYMSQYKTSLIAEFAKLALDFDLMEEAVRFANNLLLIKSTEIMGTDSYGNSIMLVSNSNARHLGHQLLGMVDYKRRYFLDSVDHLKQMMRTFEPRNVAAPCPELELARMLYSELPYRDAAEKYFAWAREKILFAIGLINAAETSDFVTDDPYLNFVRTSRESNGAKQLKDKLARMLEEISAPIDAADND